MPTPNQAQTASPAHTPAIDLAACMSAGHKGAYIYETPQHSSRVMVGIGNLRGEQANPHYDAVISALNSHASDRAEIKALTESRRIALSEAKANMDALKKADAEIKALRSALASMLHSVDTAQEISIDQAIAARAALSLGNPGPA